MSNGLSRATIGIHSACCWDMSSHEATWPGTNHCYVLVYYVKFSHNCAGVNLSLNNNKNNERISRTPFNVSHAQLR